MSKKTSSLDGTWTLLSLLSVAGLLLSIHLIWIHLQVNLDPGYVSGCGLSDKMNCETVALSEYSVFFGVPIAFWGLLLYGMFLGLAAWGMKQDEDAPQILSAGFLLSLLAGIGSAVLAWISHFKIKALCPSCIGTYIVNELLLLLMIVSLLRTKLSPFATIGNTITAAKNHLRFFVMPPVLAVVMIAAIPNYWNAKISSIDPGIATGKTSDGHSWIGAKNPTLTIVEYADYQCPFCKRSHAQMRRIVAQHKDYVRLIHRHYPLDHHCNPNIRRKFHPKACLLSYAAHCAALQKQFWPINDVLYKHSKRLNPYLLKRLARKQGLDVKKFTACLNTKETRMSILKDIKDASVQGIRGTPSFIIDGQLHLGRIKGLDKMLAAARQKAKQRSATPRKTPVRKVAAPPARRSNQSQPPVRRTQAAPAKAALRVTTSPARPAPRKADKSTGGVTKTPVKPISR